MNDIITILIIMIIMAITMIIHIIIITTWMDIDKTASAISAAKDRAV